jgi:hypothetical protein
MDGISSVVKNQLSFNKMCETQLDQLLDAVSSAEIGKILGQPGSSVENVNAMTMRGDKTTSDPPYPNHAIMEKESKKAEEPLNTYDAGRVDDGKMTPHEFYDT